MPNITDTYTYRTGKRVALEKRSDQFVVRASPEALERLNIMDAEQVSSSSFRVTTRATDLEALMSRSRHLAPTHHAYYLTDTGEELLITDRVFVTFKEPPSPDTLDTFAGRYALIKQEAYSETDFLFQLTNHTGMNPVKLVVKLTEEEPLVAFAEHDLNQRMQKYQFTLPSDPAYARQWHLHTRYLHAEVDPRSSSLCEDAWQLLDGYGSPDIVVGVTDDGCKLDHPDFNGPNKFAGWGYLRGQRLITGTDIDANPANMYKPGANHGTSCAGVIAAEVDALLTVGAAPGCKLLPIQWESSGPSLFISDSKLLTVLNYVAYKVDILSNSWGGVPTSIWALPVVNRIAALAQSGGRRGKGIVFLWAAGNENCPIQHMANLDVPYTDGVEVQGGSLVWVGVQTARHFENNLVGVPGVIHVAALSSNAQRSHYSNYGTGIGVCAPTSNRHQYFRLTVKGLRITASTGESGGVTDAFGGTSSATPLVAGVAALVLSANASLNSLEVISILKQTASKNLSLETYPRTPVATFDPDTSWDVSPIAPFDKGDFTDIGSKEGSWSPWYGHGRIDAPAAVAEALRRKTAASSKSFRKSAEPGLAIPDNNPTGVKDTLRFSQTATVGTIKVNVNIIHPFVGDLRLTLVVPSGRSVMLHDRKGGNADNLNTTFDMSTTPALSALIGQSIKGDWTLHVQDLAQQDTGRFESWELELIEHNGAPVLLEETPGVPIPDNDPNGMERSQSTSTTGKVGSVEVDVDITHTYIGDLRVQLLSPMGTLILLHDRMGGNTDNLIRTYHTGNTPALAGLSGEAVKGTWKLNVADFEAADAGKLNRWAVRIVREP